MPLKEYSDGGPSWDPEAALNLRNFQIFDLEDIFRDISNQITFHVNTPGVCESFSNHTFQVRGELGLQYPFSDST